MKDETLVKEIYEGHCNDGGERGDGDGGEVYLLKVVVMRVILMVVMMVRPFND